MNFALRIPDYYKDEIEELKGNVSINQFIINALAEKISSLKTLDYLEERAKKGSVDDMLNILNRVPDVEADKYDRL
ncbi:MAG: CopG family transcriptional regulator [uncultured Sulfurovum sp.]|uniref:CopG family transcriptional regulator n=1 Tax=uncultured Sulfurovum sp. TaxID=269237 RepID=A0A6S6SHP3_9BACT|nr:MAG: CopG family transcriptional regulator [uncultured Sulfurovum sp.]